MLVRVGYFRRLGCDSILYKVYNDVSKGGLL